MDFTIDNQYLRGVTKTQVTYRYQPDQELTAEQTMDVLRRGNIQGSVMWEEQHPEFEKLREQLGKTGYIRIERGWWNGDQVLRPFKLNGRKFRRGDQFPCAMALGVMEVVNDKPKAILGSDQPKIGQ